MSRILVTGGLGFIGTNLTLRLLKSGDEVVVIDNAYTSSLERISAFEEYDGFEFINQDVTTPFDELNVDGIYHLAAPASPIKYSRNPAYTVRTIVEGAFNALECARNNDCRILVASTSEIYGECEEHPQSETYNGNVCTMSTRACYDEAKRCAETVSFCYHETYGVNVVCPRIFNTYGPYMQLDDGRVMTSFISSLLKSEPLRIFGDGEQTRSFCYIDDLLDGLELVFSSSLKGKAINIGNDFEISINKLADIFEEICGRSFERIYEKRMDHEPMNRCPDLSLIRNTLGYRPRMNIRDGLIRMVEFYRRFDGSHSSHPNTERRKAYS